MVALGTPCFFAVATTAASCGLDSGSEPYTNQGLSRRACQGSFLVHIHFEIEAIWWVVAERCLAFPACSIMSALGQSVNTREPTSSFALSCLIFDHLLCPEHKRLVVVKYRQLSDPSGRILEECRKELRATVVMNKDCICEAPPRRACISSGNS